jgi:hypothetical protein
MPRRRADTAGAGSRGGDGEDIVAIAVPPGVTIVHVNPVDNDERLVMAPVRTGFEEALRPGHQLVRRLVHDTGLPDDYADAIVGQSFPIQMNTTQDLTPIGELAAEAYRTCKSGGELAFHCSSCDREALVEAFRRAGFIDVYLDERRYARGRKP